MNFHLSRFIAIASCVLTTTMLFQARGFADRYNLTEVVHTQRETFAAGDDFGNYTIDMTGWMSQFFNRTCGSVENAASCYATYYVGNSAPVMTTYVPALWVDPHPIAGTDSCALAPGTGFHAYNILCANGHMIFSGEYDLPDGNYLRGIWVGSNPDVSLDYLGDHSIDGGFMTANGNAYFIDGLNDSLDVALNLDASPIPEPESIFLLGTGLVALLGIARKRLSVSDIS
ncbi:MAG TPA: PEP-CTERM sorting domain-containing protein [Edaphobacter sp.]|nr:PEP-CTERM sorting domain-containing protein [Edaphobacter sp.]